MINQKLRVLVVDDEPILSMTTADMLAELGLEAFEANSGVEGLSIIENGSGIDLIVTDYRMPEMSGLEFAALAREKLPDVPVLLASGYTDRHEAEIGSIALLAKPFSITELAVAIDQLAGTKLSELPNSG